MRRKIPVIRNRGLVISDRVIVHLKYVSQIALAPAAVFGSIEFRINSLNDPGSSGDTTQPVGFDQWQAFYNRYRVFAVNYKVSACTEANTGAGFMLITTVSNAVYVPASMREQLEQRYSKSKIMQLQSSAAIIRGHANLPRLTGRTPTQYKGFDQTQAVTTADPSEICTLTVGVGAIDGLTNVVCTIMTEFVMHAEMFDRNVLAVS